MKSYTCPSCGAELICDETTAATSCPYCGNTTIVPGQLSGMQKPDYIIPFKLSKEDAIAALKNHYKKKPLLPKAFSAQNHIDSIQGIYVPFWLFNGSTSANLSYHCTRVEKHQEGNYDIINTDHYSVQRSGTVKFERIPVKASSKMPEENMNAIEPFQYDELTPFSNAYLPGFLADKYASVQTLSEFADVVYDYYTLGIGSERNATLFVVCTLSEEYIISAYGPMATSAIGNAEAEQISDEVYKCLYDGRWYDAYANFLSYCKQYLSLCQETFVTEPEQTTNPVVPANPVAPASDAPAKNPRKFNGFLIIFIPLIVSIIVCLSMKGKMRTAIKQKKADDYIPCNGVTLTRQYENYLTTTREKKRR